MKTLLFIIFLTSLSQASVTGTTHGCPENAQLIANEGEQFVTVRLGNKETKLLSVSGKPFSTSSPETVSFRSDDKNSRLGDVSLELEMPAMVSGNLPRLIVTHSGIQNKCKVEIYGPDIK